MGRGLTAPSRRTPPQAVAPSGLAPAALTLPGNDPFRNFSMLGGLQMSVLIAVQGAKSVTGC